MSVVRFISDYHFGHSFMMKLRGFKTLDEMHEHIITEHNKVVKKKDLTKILGDIGMHSSKYYYLLDRMNGRKQVLLGNHDSPEDVPELLKHVESIGAMEKYKGVFLTHCPIHPQELEYRVAYNIHGHIHENNVKYSITAGTRVTKGKDDPRYINVCCEMIDYRPRTLAELLPEYEYVKRKQNAST